MDYKVLYRKYRPKDFNDLVGQDHIKELLLQSILNNKLSHAFIFNGPRGTGKTSTAKLFAKIINCTNNFEGNACNKCISCLSYEETIDIIEIDAASNNGVDEIRELRENIKILPSLSRYKVYIIDEVHMLSTNAWNAFLKTLEEPPKHVIFILATTEIQKVPITVLSRCQRFDFQRISNDVIFQKVKEIAKKEKINISDEAIIELSELSNGGLRDALGMLDQLSKLSDKITIGTLNNAYGLVTNKDIKEIFEEYKNREIKLLIENVNNLNLKGANSDVLLTKMLDFLLQELIKYKISNIKEINNLEQLIFDLEECYNKKNKYLMIKTILLKNVEDSVENIEIENRVKEEKNISREIISDEILEQINLETFNIRINNSFVNANLNLKKEFIKKWDELTNYFCAIGETKYLSLLKNTKVEVVSPTNVLISTNTYNNSVLFNLICDEISEKCKKIIGDNIKIICLDEEQWKKEKSKYIKNKKIKEYSYIEEPVLKNNTKTINIATDIFGEELIEIK
ncbi:MAG: DNA polymerase III subunit gamma/tau [Bacilli bacterium]|nr:DNA polymerase III subunit gamma/tau [Bacilli bacterium]MDD3895669.1 DNA polymerase III subunit gamma/tau [Bacilli bacterium]MDD4407480.1 DNA polymerase III subunit gamma/tau [Bacilli bacterium]